MPTLRAPTDLCAGTLAVPIVGGCEGASRVEWSVIDKPAGTQVIFSDDSSESSTIDVSADGAYLIRLACYFDAGTVIAPSAPPEPSIGCPISVTAGELAAITLVGCENGTITWAVSGAATSSIGDDVNGTTILTSVDMLGVVTVSATCKITDIDGVETVTVHECTFNVVAEMFDVCEYSEEFSVSAIQCGETCQTKDTLFVFDCGTTTCQTAYIGLVFKDCPPCEQPEECIPLASQQLRMYTTP